MIVRLNPWLAGAVLSAGYVLGRRDARAHLRDLAVRERESAVVRVEAGAGMPAGDFACVLVVGNCVVAPDAFRRTVGYWRNRAGSRRAGHDEQLVERARREALLRLKDAARSAGAATVIDLHFETTSFAGADLPGPVEVMATGTALVPRPPS